MKKNNQINPVKCSVSNRVKIGIDARMYGARQTGIGNYIKHLIEYLAKLDKKNEYTIFLLKSEFEKFKFPASNFKKQKVSAHWYSWREQFILPFEFKKAKVDLMHFPHFNRPILYPTRNVVTIHDLTPKFFPGHKMNSPIRKAGFWLTFSQAVKKTKKIIAVSEATKKDIIKYFQVAPEKITVIYEGVDENANNEGDIGQCRLRLKEKYNITKPFILYVGVWRNHKNMVGLIKAFNTLLRKYQLDYQLVLTGEENLYYPEIRKTWENLGLEKNIIRPGFVSKEELTCLYNEASLCVIPSFYEGFGLVGLEAMARGIPVASSNIAGLTEILGEAAVFFDPYSIDEMARKMAQILLNDGLRKKMINKGFEQIKKYSWEKMAKETLEVYKEAIIL